MMKMICIAKCKKINKKSKAKGFQKLEVGDIMSFSIEIAAVGSNSRGGTYAPCIKYKNKRTGEIGSSTFNELGRRLENYEFEQLNSEEMCNFCKKNYIAEEQ